MFIIIGTLNLRTVTLSQKVLIIVSLTIATLLTAHISLNNNPNFSVLIFAYLSVYNPCRCLPPPGPPYIVSPPENITVNISQNAQFTCQAEAYPGNLTYTWYWEEDNVYFKK